MVYLGFKTAKKACHLKGGWFFFKHFCFYGKAQRGSYLTAVKRLYKLGGQRMQLVDRVTPLVEAWEPACVETSQYIKSHETAPTLQISYCIVEHIKKKKNRRRKICAPMREKPHVLGPAAFTSLLVRIL